MSDTAPRTLAQKVWDRHVVRSAPGEPDLLYIDLHLVHEVTSPQAFDGLRMTGRDVRRPQLTLATEDHNVPTADIGLHEFPGVLKLPRGIVGFRQPDAVALALQARAGQASRLRRA